MNQDELVITRDEHAQLLKEASAANQNRIKAEAYDKLEKINRKTTMAYVEDFGHRARSIIEETNALLKGK